MYTPVSEKRKIINSKTKKKEEKIEYKCKADKRDRFISQFGKEKFDQVCKNDSKWEELKDLPFPSRFTFLTDLFLKVWGTSRIDFAGNRLFQAQDILNYCTLTGVKLTYYEGRLLLKMGLWAAKSVRDVRELSNEM